MTVDVFKEWFKQMLDELPPNSVIVMDNATSYHGWKSVKILNSSSKKVEILEWLLNRSINVPVLAIKAELLQLV